MACAAPNLKIVEHLGAADRLDRVWYTEFPEPTPDGRWAPYPDRPGLGLEPDPDALANNSVD